MPSEWQRDTCSRPHAHGRNPRHRRRAGAWDVTITRRSTGERIEGYLFDCTTGASTAESKVRIIPRAGADRVTIPYADIAELGFTGRDTAEGRSFETWMKRYVEKKLAGEEASIESERLEEQE